ncbi:IclR family transcriptional regulator [Salinigranum marinum]|uniref:IclR family transcriptional regulator n=1 Tax=Salinigranum marinum TaxID=1515595 RepID=UPI002989BB8F|nr:IclR family transcriptional regulator [Salinigranum marinum]
MAPAQRRPVKTVETAFAILERLKREGPLGPTALAADLGMAKSTVHRHLRTLEREGAVVGSDDGYRVGLRFLDFGVAARNAHALYAVAAPKVDELAGETGEKVWCITAEAGRAVHLYGATGEGSVRTYAREGARTHLHQHAAGKAILAHLPDDRVHEICDRHGLPAKTEHTITDRDDLFADLRRVRDRGFALNREESVPKLNAVGVPITDESGRAIGAISVSGPSNRLDGDRLTDGLPNLLLGAANEIEINLSYA